jgi:hypothetical protein
MANDADTAGQVLSDDRIDSPLTTHARTDRRSAGRSVETSPESLYLWQIAVLQTRVDDLERAVDRREQDLQHVIDRYEHVLDERTVHDGELRTDGGATTHPTERDASRETPPASTASEPGRPGIAGRVLARIRSLLE